MAGKKMAITFERIRKIVDGDTLRVDLTGCRSVFGLDIPCRLAGVDAPSIRDRNPGRAVMAVGIRDMLTRYLTSHPITSFTILGRDKYFRWDVDVETADGPIKTWLMANGWGVEYDVEGSVIPAASTPPLNETFSTYTTQLNPTRIHRCIDGDTFIADLTETDPLVRDRVPIRIANIDAPELDDPNPVQAAKAQQAKTRLEELLGTASQITFYLPWRDKYFRLRSAVYANGQSVARVLVNEGLAVNTSKLPDSYL